MSYDEHLISTAGGDTLHEFRDPTSNAARDDILTAMKSRAMSTGEIFDIGRSRALFDGVITGIIGTLHKKGIIQSAGQGWWTLADGTTVPETFRPEVVGEVETITPDTTRVGDTIVHNGVAYTSRNATDVPALLALVREQQDQLDRVLELAHWAGKRGWQIPPAALRKTINGASA